MSFGELFRVEERFRRWTIILSFFFWVIYSGTGRWHIWFVRLLRYSKKAPLKEASPNFKVGFSRPERIASTP